MGAAPPRRPTSILNQQPAQRLSVPSAKGHAEEKAHRELPMPYERPDQACEKALGVTSLSAVSPSAGFHKVAGARLTAACFSSRYELNVCIVSDPMSTRSCHDVQPFAFRNSSAILRNSEALANSSRASQRGFRSLRRWRSRHPCGVQVLSTSHDRSASELDLS